MSSSKFRIRKICAYCGNEFEAQKHSTQYCSRRCSQHAYKDRKRLIKKKNAESLSVHVHRTKELESIKDKEYLSVADTAKLIGLTRDGVYKLIYRGILKAYKITSHLTIIYRKDIDEMISTRPYEVLPPKPKEPEDTTEYYSTQELQEKFSLSLSAFYRRAQKHNIPKVNRKGRAYWAKKQCDAIFGDNDPLIESITEWYTVADVQEKYGMDKHAIYNFVSKIGIPRKKIGAEVLYSKRHFDAAKGVAAPIKCNWYSYQDLHKKYNLNKEQIYHFCKHYNIPKKKVGKYTYISKAEMDKVMKTVFPSLS